jgi:hypothetical protein
VVGCAGAPKPKPAEPPQQIISTHGRHSGVVQMVTEFRFVVLDFAGSVPPPSGTELDVMRDGIKVGVVKADAPTREFPSMLTADILEGDVRKGDRVRVQPPPALENSGTPTPDRTPSNILPRRRSR